MLRSEIIETHRVPKLSILGRNFEDFFKVEDKPIREIRTVTAVRSDSLPLADIMGTVYRIFYSNEEREVFVPREGKKRLYELACLLNPGRTGKLIDEIRTLTIEGPDGVVPQNTIDKIKKHVNVSNLEAAKKARRFERS